MVIRARTLDSTACPQCESLRAELEAARRRGVELEAETDVLRGHLREALKMVDLQQADLDRLRAEQERTRPNRPERAPSNEMQLALERVVATFGDAPAANDTPSPTPPTPPDAVTAPASSVEGSEPKGGLPDKKRHRHGRRRLDLTNLPVEIIKVDPDEVRATGGEGFQHIGDEVSERIAFKPAQYVRLVLVPRSTSEIAVDTRPVLVLGSCRRGALAARRAASLRM